MRGATRKQLREGDWLVRPARGLYFKRAWFEMIDPGVVPAEVLARVRYWDRAATLDGDWTAGVRMTRLPTGIYIVEHVQRLRDRPLGVRRTVKSHAETDPEATIVGFEEDPGQAGVAEADDYVRELAGFNIRKVRPTGDKVTRAQPYSAQCEAGNVKVVRGPWNEDYLNELEAFPEGDYDDQVDGSSGAFNMLAKYAPYGGGARGAGSTRR